MELRELTQPEQKYTYRQSHQLDAQTGCIGYLRGDFGTTGKEFYSSWFDNMAYLKTPEFQAELDQVINALREDSQYSGILADRSSLSNACRQSTTPKFGRDESGFRVNTKDHAYLLRLNSSPGDYNFYVIPSELWMDVRGYIEDGVGCWIVEPDGNVVKKKTARKMECKLNRSYVLARIVQALEREHMKYIERDWKRRRLAKGVTDYGRNRLWRGDIVEYSQRRWIVSDVIFKKDGTASNPQVIITDERSGNCTVAPASAVRKVVERKGI